MRPCPRALPVLAALIALAASPSLRAQPPATAGGPPPAGALRVVVDPRVELVSVACRLAGFEEYVRGRVPRWTAAVDSQFAPLRDHAAVARLRRLREERGIGYDAPMSLAVHLEPGLSFAARLSLDPWPPRLDARWNAAEADAFLAALRDFATASDFAGFWERQLDLRRETAARLEGLVRARDLPGWFERWFGTQAGADFVLAAGLLNGDANYGTAARLPDGREELWSILGVWQVDADGLPTFGMGVLPTVVHEFAHSFANPLVAAHADGLRAAGEALFARVGERMRRQAYADWQTMLCESLVRAAAARWTTHAYGSVAGLQAVRREHDRGFLWTGELYGLLEGYERDRATYPTLAAFMPRVIETLDAWAARIDDELAADAARREAELADLRARGPQVVALTPPDGARDVDPALPAVTVVFDRPLQAGRLAVMALDDVAFPPLSGGAGFDSTRAVLTLPVRLAPGTAYGFGLNSASHLVMRDDAGNPLAPVEVRFSTRP